MKSLSCKTILSGRAPAGEAVTLRGWVRTRRDSKAGLSFVHVSDGSCFHPVQVVAEGRLANYESEVKRLTAGCAVEAVGFVGSFGTFQKSWPLKYPTGSVTWYFAKIWRCTLKMSSG